MTEAPTAALGAAPGPLRQRQPHPDAQAPLAFGAHAREALANANLQRALHHVKEGFQDKRLAAMDRLPEFDALRDAARDIKDHVLAHLDIYLERFATAVEARGGHVHWARDAAEARAMVLDICRRENARTVTKGKSMVAEEIGLNPFLEENGIEPVETDLGEYIVQLRGETPSHIIAPAIHVVKEEIADAFRREHEGLAPERDLTDRRALLDEARVVLRRRYFQADVGITGANFLVAETGSGVIVTNEGNGDMTRTLPRVHVALATIEKIVPTLDDLAVLLRVLARSATGQDFSTYTTVYTGARRPDDPDGPEAFHVVLLDNGRSALLGGELREVLRCIRCGACMNHCPVYQRVGGHAYGWVYPGPIGAIMTPALTAIATSHPLPNASTLCGRCEEVCPVRIPLPKLLRYWRTEAAAAGLPPLAERLGLTLWAWLARRPALYRLAVRQIARRLKARAGDRGALRRLPLMGGWAGHWLQGRDLPAPQGRSFMDQWRAQKKGTRL